MTEERDLEKSIDEAYEIAEDAWDIGGVRGFIAWLLMSAFLMGMRVRLWLLRKGLIK